MAKKIVYPLVAILGIAVALGAAWWYQSKPTGPKEVVAGAAAAPASSPGVQASGPAVPRAAGVEVAKVETMSLRDDAQSVGIEQIYTQAAHLKGMTLPDLQGQIAENFARIFGAI
jgi:membrane fusion protein (multidrug efflux system)